MLPSVFRRNDGQIYASESLKNPFSAKRSGISYEIEDAIERPSGSYYDLPTRSHSRRFMIRVRWHSVHLRRINERGACNRPSLKDDIFGFFTDEGKFGRSVTN